VKALRASSNSAAVTSELEQEINIVAFFFGSLCRHSTSNKDVFAQSKPPFAVHCGRGPGQAQKNCQHLGTLRYVGIFVKINLGAQKTIVVFIYLFRIRRDRNKKGGAMTAFSF